MVLPLLLLGFGGLAWRLTHPRDKKTGMKSWLSTGSKRLKARF
jgi:hypothetical protein